MKERDNLGGRETTKLQDFFIIYCMTEKDIETKFSVNNGLKN